ncbi:MAG: NERD domain-containing protein [Gammaproteobacteria bacterium]|nr:NERD domain-containing protein [Gammaproteobacteria bacterium]MBU2056877.1 NERD domain-containing protein [Gammaproteobacteria bacterium]MBU2174591.1 NERD domain-containing protein [Gammaproteobacteria bacterium]MBU2248284.1 NERD domain-containing protein [Gammaproteobacteria bacterium]MBU2343712.1 NERD domain-containing protein [Gammaproteobacteria bacterium]
MIVKDKLQKAAVGVRKQAGDQQEQDVAFYLRRAFKDEDRVRVFHDLQLCYDGEFAQIDHLIVYTFGFIVIESKSIKGEVRVNAQAEWSRSYRQQWQGMPSPVKQAQLQLKVLRDVLTNNHEKMLGRLLGLIQLGLGGRCYDVLCAISSDAIIDRSKTPKDVAAKLVKTEFIADALKDLMRLPKLLPVALRVFDTRPAFNAEELKSICHFLLTEHLKLRPEEQDVVQAIKPSPVKDRKVVDTQTVSVWQVAEKPLPATNQAVKAAATNTAQLVNGLCKHCQTWDQLSVHAGRYGYYLKCHMCQKNTALKQPCTQCHSPYTKVRKDAEKYLVDCGGCGYVWRVL